MALVVPASGATIQRSMHFSQTGLTWVQDADTLTVGGALLLGAPPARFLTVDGRRATVDLRRRRVGRERPALHVRLPIGPLTDLTDPTEQLRSSGIC